MKYLLTVLTSACLASLIAPSLHASPTVVFQDHFDRTDRFDQDERLQDSDHIDGFYVVRGNHENYTYAVADSQLHVTANSSENTEIRFFNDDAYTSDFNFFDASAQTPLRFSVRGFEQTIDSTFEAFERRMLLSFMLTSDAETHYRSDDAFTLFIRASNEFSVGSKTNSSNANVRDNLLSEQAATGRITGWDLDLSETHYKLVVYSEDGGSTYDQTFQGTHNLSVADWGDGSGDAYLTVYHNKTTVNVPVTWSYGSIEVTQVPEPGSLGLLGLGGVMLIGRTSRPTP